MDHIPGCEYPLIYSCLREEYLAPFLEDWVLEPYRCITLGCYSYVSVSLYF